MLQKTVCDEGIVILTMGDKECKCCKKSQHGQKMKGPSSRCREGYAFQSDFCLDGSEWQRLDEYASNMVVYMLVFLNSTKKHIC